VNDHQKTQADNNLGKTDELPKTRRNISKKKAKPASTEDSNKEEIQQTEAETLKEKPKKKKNRKSKKKANDEEDKENIVPQNGELKSVNSSKTKANAANTAHTDVNDENATVVNDENATVVNDENATVVNKSSKKAHGKKKHSSTREPLSEVVNKEMEQGDYSIDYKSLHDALRQSFTIDDKHGPIHFAPPTNKSKKFHENLAPKFSYSTSSTGDTSRNSNKSSPSAKSKYLVYHLNNET
jgi:hypothetical protein